MQHYRWVLMTCHSGAELEVALEMAKGHLSDDLRCVFQGEKGVAPAQPLPRCWGVLLQPAERQPLLPLLRTRPAVTLQQCKKMQGNHC
jgi:hypothetical protein